MVLPISYIIMMMFVLNIYNKNSLKCPLLLLWALWSCLSCKSSLTCFHLVNGNLIFRLGRPQQPYARYWGLGGSFKFMTTLPHTNEDWQGRRMWASQVLTSFGRGSCFSVVIQTILSSIMEWICSTWQLIWKNIGVVFAKILCQRCIGFAKTFY